MGTRNQGRITFKHIDLEDRLEIVCSCRFSHWQNGKRWMKANAAESHFRNGFIRYSKIFLDIDLIRFDLDSWNLRFACEFLNWWMSSASLHCSEHTERTSGPGSFCLKWIGVRMLGAWVLGQCICMLYDFRYLFVNHMTWFCTVYPKWVFDDLDGPLIYKKGRVQVRYHPCCV